MELFAKDSPYLTPAVTRPAHSHIATSSAPQLVRVALVALPLTAWGLERLMGAPASRLRCVGVAHSGAEAVLQVDAWRPDVVLFDLDGEDGTESLADLHASTQAKVLALTSSPHTAEHDAAILAGARGVVDKREAPEVLLTALEKVYQGESWIDRSATGRIFMELARQRTGVRREDPDKARIAQLTPRERQMVEALAQDAASPGKVLAQRLHISENTFRNHLTSINSKLGVSNRVELYAFALKHGLGISAA